MEAAKPEVLALVESWLREVCPETLDMKEVHLVARLCELSVWTYKERGMTQCHPGRAYLSALVGWSVTKVSRFTSKLRDWGILRKYQPRMFNTEKQQWEPSTAVYAIAFLGLARVRQLAALLKIDLAHMKKESSQEKREKESCVQISGRKSPVPAGHVARQVYRRLLDMGKNGEPEVVIHTGNVAMNAVLNRFARLGKGQSLQVKSDSAHDCPASASARTV